MPSFPAPTRRVLVAASLVALAPGAAATKRKRKTKTKKRGKPPAPPLAFVTATVLEASRSNDPERFDVRLPMVIVRPATEFSLEQELQTSIVVAPSTAAARAAIEAEVRKTAARLLEQSGQAVQVERVAVVLL